MRGGWQSSPQSLEGTGVAGGSLRGHLDPCARVVWLWNGTKRRRRGVQLLR